MKDVSKKLFTQPRFEQVRAESKHHLWRFNSLGQMDLEAPETQMALWLALKGVCIEASVYCCWHDDGRVSLGIGGAVHEHRSAVDGENLANALLQTYRLLDELESKDDTT